MPVRIPDSIRDVFRAVANNPRYSDSSVEELHEVACRTILDSRIAQETELPSIEWTYRYVRPFRKYRHPWLDYPWSMGTLGRSECDIDPLALPYVIRIWRRSVAQDRRLTNREAMWVSRLFPLLAEEENDSEIWRLDSLFGWAIRYAQEERAAEVLKETADTTVLDLWMATEDQLGTEYGSSSQPFELLALRLLDDTGGLNVLDDARQIDRARSLTKDYDKFPFEGDSVNWPEGDTSSREVMPILRVMEQVMSQRNWAEPNDLQVELLTLGLRELARWDTKWRQLQSGITHTEEERDDQLLAACKDDVNALIDILDKFQRLAIRDFEVWENTDEGQAAQESGAYEAWHEFERPMDELADAFLAKIGSRLRRNTT